MHVDILNGKLPLETIDGELGDLEFISLWICQSYQLEEYRNDSVSLFLCFIFSFPY